MRVWGTIGLPNLHWQGIDRLIFPEPMHSYFSIEPEHANSTYPMRGCTLAGIKGVLPVYSPNIAGAPAAPTTKSGNDAHLPCSLHFLTSRLRVQVPFFFFFRSGHRPGPFLRVSGACEAQHAGAESCSRTAERNRSICEEPLGIGNCKRNSEENTMGMGQMKPPGNGPQGLVHVSIYQGCILSTYF